MATIRMAKPRDAAGIARVHVMSWRDTYAGLLPSERLVGMRPGRYAGWWARWLRGQGRSQVILVAEEREQGVVGFASGGRARVRGLPYEGEVYMLYLLPDHQGGGVGRRLLAAQFRALTSHGVRSAMVWVLAQNPSRFFYEAMGGRVVATRRDRFWGGDLEEWAYGWDDLAAAAILKQRRSLS